MTDHETTLLSDRLHRLADTMTPSLDVVGQVREARNRNRRQRRMRVALVAVVTAAAATVVGTATAVDLLSVRSDGEVAVKTTTPAPTFTPAPIAPEPEPTPAPAPSPAEEVSSLPAGWEARSFLGVTFAVPPGARTDDYVAEDPPVESDGGPTFIWNGPDLAGDGTVFSHVKVQVGGIGDSDMHDGADPVVVAGARQASSSTQIGTPVDADMQPFEVLDLSLHASTPDHRNVHVQAQFPVGPVGEQMVRDLIASLDLSGLQSG